MDWTVLYPRDITILEGKDLLKTTIIRPTSRVRQVYASCCHTPLFRFGEMSVVRRFLVLIHDGSDANWNNSIVSQSSLPCSLLMVLANYKS